MNLIGKSVMIKKMIGLFAFLTIGFLFGCQTFQQTPDDTLPPTSSPISARETESDNAFPSATSAPPMVQTATPTATPLPPTDGIQISLEDLPASFIEVPREMLSIRAINLSGQEFSNENPFLFVNNNDFQLVFGFSTLLSSDEDKAKFQTIIEYPERSAKSFADFYNVVGFSQAPKFNGLPNLGDTQANM
ncbi:MAG: hypothetical protein B6243_10905, partial [Anaerolineaceae bacterium 4572_5.2]